LPFPSAGTAVSLFRAKTVQQRPLLPREVETWLPDCWREATRRVQLSRNQAAVDHVRWVAVEDLVLRQEDKPKKHWSSREISHEIVILYSSVHRKIIHGDLQLTCFKRRHAHCSAVVWSQSYLSSHLLINKLLVCNKSCYCYLLHYKQ